MKKCSSLKRLDPQQNSFNSNMIINHRVDTFNANPIDEYIQIKIWYTLNKFFTRTLSFFALGLLYLFYKIGFAVVGPGFFLIETIHQYCWVGGYYLQSMRKRTFRNEFRVTKCT